MGCECCRDKCEVEVGRLDEAKGKLGKDGAIWGAEGTRGGGLGSWVVESGAGGRGVGCCGAGGKLEAS